MEIVQIIIFWGIGLFIYLVSLFTRLQPADWNGWLGFFGSLLGSIIAIFGVYWQVSVQSKKSQEDAKKQKDLLSRQLKNEKENQYRQARPFFIVSKGEIYMDSSNIVKSVSAIYSPLDRGEIANISETCIIINNVSKRDMYAVKVLASTSTDDDFKQEFQKYSSATDLKNNKFYEECISIDKITANEKIGLLFNSSDKDIQQVWVWYITEIRESIKLYFKNEDGRLVYQPDEKRLENQQEDDSAIYDLSDFKETKKLSDQY